MSEETRVCNTCGGEEKDIEEFGWTGKNGDKFYRRRKCKVCVKKADKIASASKKVKDYTCIFDPSGIYNDGNILTHGKMRDTLNIGYMSSGSKWSRGEEVFVVKGNKHWNDIVECVRKPNPEYLKEVREKQRLVKI